MVEAKLRVEMLENREGSKNPFYGSTIVKKVVEDTLIHEKDTRSDIAPYGVCATLIIDSKVVLGEGDEPLLTKKVFDIKVNRYYFDHEGEGRYLAFFQIEEKTYELFVHFDEKNSLDTITLSEWLNEGDYEDCDDADNVYHTMDFACVMTDKTTIIGKYYFGIK
jgi:hypothetical protein